MVERGKYLKLGIKRHGRSNIMDKHREREWQTDIHRQREWHTDIHRQRDTDGVKERDRERDRDGEIQTGRVPKSDSNNLLATFSSVSRHQEHHHHHHNNNNIDQFDHYPAHHCHHHFDHYYQLIILANTSTIIMILFIISSFCQWLVQMNDLHSLWSVLRSGASFIVVPSLTLFSRQPTFNSDARSNLELGVKL